MWFRSEPALSCDRDRAWRGSLTSRYRVQSVLGRLPADKPQRRGPVWGDNAMATRAKCSGRLLCATAKSRPISGELLRLLSYHLIHNYLICTDSVPTLRGGARKPGLLTELLLRLTHRGTILSDYPCAIVLQRPQLSW